MTNAVSHSRLCKTICKNSTFTLSLVKVIMVETAVVLMLPWQQKAQHHSILVAGRASLIMRVVLSGGGWRVISSVMNGSWLVLTFTSRMSRANTNRDLTVENRRGKEFD